MRAYIRFEAQTIIQTDCGTMIYYKGEAIIDSPQLIQLRFRPQISRIKQLLFSTVISLRGFSFQFQARWAPSVIKLTFICHWVNSNEKRIFRVVALRLWDGKAAYNMRICTTSSCAKLNLAGSRSGSFQSRRQKLIWNVMNLMNRWRKQWNEIWVFRSTSRAIFKKNRSEACCSLLHSVWNESWHQKIPIKL